MKPCDPAVYEKGTGIAVLAILKEDAERMCRTCTEVTGHLCDWHYAGGRVVIKSLAPSDDIQSTIHFWSAVVKDNKPGLMKVHVPATAVKLDAARYQWMRKHFTNLVVHTEVTLEDKAGVAKLTVRDSTFKTDARSVDAAVDAAMKVTP